MRVHRHKFCLKTGPQQPRFRRKRIGGGHSREGHQQWKGGAGAGGGRHGATPQGEGMEEARPAASCDVAQSGGLELVVQGLGSRLIVKGHDWDREGSRLGS